MKTYKYIEFLIIFILFPIILASNLPFFVKYTPILIGILYVIYLLFKSHVSIDELLKFRKPNKIEIIKFISKFSLIIVFSLCYVLFFMPDSLFNIVRKNWIIWIAILFIYTIFSVIPQELLYRFFYFKRYKFSDNYFVEILINSAVFSLAHLYFHNTLILVITFMGGIMFSLSYRHYNSIIITSIEHAVYGFWIITVGFGVLLGFDF